VDITYRIPSKKVPYGYIEFTWKRESGTGMPDPDEMAAEYADYIKRYQAAEIKAFETPPKAAPKVEDKSVEEATKILDEGLDGVTEVNESDPPAPWDKTSDETESTEEKPWDLDDSDWDM
jgi:hypothetical protein